MTSPTQTLGFQKEAEACSYLQSKGFKLIQQHYHCRYGEIDLIMQEKDCLVFVEVRLRTHSHFGSALESITAHKQQKLIHTAQHFLQHHSQWQQYDCRFDVVVFEGKNSKPLWLAHAFTEAY